MKHYNQLLSPDAVDGDADLTKIDTSFPRAVAGQYDFLLDKVTKKTAASDSETQYLEVYLKTTGNWSDTGGGSHNAGEVLIDRIFLTPKGKRTIDQINKSVASLVQAARCRTMNDLINGVANGRTVKCKVKVGAETAEYDESNRFNYIVPRS